MTAYRPNKETIEEINSRSDDSVLKAMVDSGLVEAVDVVEIPLDFLLSQDKFEVKVDGEIIVLPKLDEFWKLGLRHADLTGSAIGPVLEVITSYSDLRSRTGKIEVIDLLSLIQLITV